MKYEIVYTSKFKKDLKRSKKQGKDMEKLYFVIKQLSMGKKLETKYRDHLLQGKYNNSRECHIQPDWLLVYEIVEDILVLNLLRLGSHSEIL